jgi:hypothetical protein
VAERGAWALSGFAGWPPENPPSGRLKGVSVRNRVWAPREGSPRYLMERGIRQSPLQLSGRNDPAACSYRSRAGSLRRQVVLHPRHLALGGNARAPDVSFITRAIRSPATVFCVSKPVTRQILWWALVPAIAFDNGRAPRRRQRRRLVRRLIGGFWRRFRSDSRALAGAPPRVPYHR